MSDTEIKIANQETALAILDSIAKNLGSTADAQSLAVSTTRTTLSYLKGIATNWTVARATKLDTNLDATVSSRASQASVDALSTAVGTKASQSSIDSLGTVVNSRASQNSLDTLVGATANTGGTTTAGTVMGKLNALLTNMTSTRAGYLDAAITSRASQTSFDTAVGATGNTGGSSTAGTVMAKLNAILSTTISSSDWTNIKAGYLDIAISSRVSQTSFDTAIGATNNTGGTTAAGTAMAKLNALLTNLTSTRAGYLDAAISGRASQTSLDSLVTTVGATGNTGGSTTAGSVMGKLNALLTNLTSTRAGYLDAAITSRASQTSLDTLVGATGNTGGSTTAGTVMGKLNAILTSWTSTRAGYLDAAVSGRVSQTSFDTAVGATNNTGGTTTAGTVMGKLNALLTNLTSTRAGYLDASISGRLSKTDFDSLIGATGNTNGTTSSGSVMAKLNAILGGLSGGSGSGGMKCFWESNELWPVPANVTGIRVFMVSAGGGGGGGMYSQGGTSYGYGGGGGGGGIIMEGYFALPPYPCVIEASVGKGGAGGAGGSTSSNRSGVNGGSGGMSYLITHTVLPSSMNLALNVTGGGGGRGAFYVDFGEGVVQQGPGYGGDGGSGGGGGGGGTDGTSSASARAGGNGGKSSDGIQGATYSGYIAGGTGGKRIVFPTTIDLRYFGGSGSGNGGSGYISGTNRASGGGGGGSGSGHGGLGGNAASVGGNGGRGDEYGGGGGGGAGGFNGAGGKGGNGADGIIIVMW